MFEFGLRHKLEPETAPRAALAKHDEYSAVSWALGERELRRQWTTFAPNSPADGRLEGA